MTAMRMLVVMQMTSVAVALLDTLTSLPLAAEVNLHARPTYMYMPWLLTLHVHHV